MAMPAPASSISFFTGSCIAVINLLTTMAQFELRFSVFNEVSVVGL